MNQFSLKSELFGISHRKSFIILTSDLTSAVSVEKRRLVTSSLKKNVFNRFRWIGKEKSSFGWMISDQVNQLFCPCRFLCTVKKIRFIFYTGLPMSSFIYCKHIGNVVNTYHWKCRTSNSFDIRFSNKNVPPGQHLTSNTHLHAMTRTRF